MKKYLSKVVTSALTLSLMVSALPVSAATTAYDYVDVTAQVNQALAFSIVSSTAPGTDVALCALGVLAIDAVKTCTYGLRISTNGTTGFHAEFATTGTFSNGTHNFAEVGDDNVVSVGVEEYGLRIIPSTSGGWAAGAPPTWAAPSEVLAEFAGLDRPVKTATSTLSTVSYDAPYDATSGLGGANYDVNALTLVTHKASISLATPQGNYHHRVWWQVTATP